MAEQQFVVNSTGRLREVLLCAPDHFCFQPINEITRAVMADGQRADLAAMQREHAELVAAYRDAGVEVELTSPHRSCPTWSTLATSAPAWPRAR